MQQNVRVVNRTRGPFGDRSNDIEVVLATNSVIRNTYILLSLTLLFSAGTAFLSMVNYSAPVSPFVFLAGSFGLMFLCNALRNSVWGIAAVFAFTGFMGYTLGPLLNFVLHFANGAQIIAASLGLTGVMFLGLSGYALTTRKDFSYLAGFLMVGSVVAMLAVLIGIFFPIPALHLAISSAFVLITSGMILFTTSNIIHGGENNYIMATIALYVQIYNLFVSLLQIFSAISGRNE